MTPTTPATTPATPATGAGPANGGGRPGGDRLTRLLRGPETRPAWQRPAVLALLAATAVLYVWGLGASGYANEFYAAAVQAGTLDGKALLFGSLDPGNAITVDKPPAALWVMALSGRIFGFSSWSMLVPQALEGVAAVGLVYAAVRRQAGAHAGLLAGAVLALTPVAALMFRFNNPDALLVLVLVAAAYAVVRGLEHGRTRWFVLAGALVGFGFLTKLLQAFLVVPALALVVLVAAPGGWWKRIGNLLAAGAALVVSAGWYVALTELWPASSRPYIGGSTDNSLLQLTLGYNGLSRITGGGSGGGPGGGGGFPGGGGGMFGGAAGIGRMFGASFGTQISWLLPAALIALVAGLVLSCARPRAPRTDPARAGLIMWGGWLLVTGAVFSLMSGIIHPYYTVALAPAVGALVGIGGRELWRNRERAGARAVLAAMSAVTGVWAFVLLGRATWHPELRYVVLVVAVLAAGALLVPARVARRAALTGLVAAIVAGLAAPAAYAVDTAATPQTGSTPTAGPSGSSGPGGFPGGARFGAGKGRFPGNGQMPGNGRFPGNGERPGNGRFPGNGQMPGQGRQPGGGDQSGDQRGGQRGFGGGATANAALTALLKKTTTRWAAATNGSMSSAPLQLASGKAVMAIGGFNGGDPSPTLAGFKAYVADGQITYYVSGGMGGMGGMGGRGGPGGSGSASAIASWVAAHFTAKKVGGRTVYDLTAPKT